MSESVNNAAQRAGSSTRVWPLFTMGLIARFATPAGTTWQGVNAHTAGDIMMVMGALVFIVLIIMGLLGASLLGLGVALDASSRRKRAARRV
jgi:hypothetical protein